MTQGKNEVQSFEKQNVNIHTPTVGLPETAFVRVESLPVCEAFISGCEKLPTFVLKGKNVLSVCKIKSKIYIKIV